MIEDFRVHRLEMYHANIAGDPFIGSGERSPIQFETRTKFREKLKDHAVELGNSPNGFVLAAAQLGAQIKGKPFGFLGGEPTQKSIFVTELMAALESEKVRARGEEFTEESDKTFRNGLKGTKRTTDFVMKTAGILSQLNTMVRPRKNQEREAAAAVSRYESQTVEEAVARRGDRRSALPNYGQSQAAASMSTLYEGASTSGNHGRSGNRPSRRARGQQQGQAPSQS